MYTIIEYIWLDSISEFRSKTKVLMKDNISLSDLSDWNYDGSSTKQASGTDSEIIIKPRALFNDPFRGNQHKLVLCDTFNSKMEPLTNNNRIWANDIFNQKLELEPWFGLEQEYFIINPISKQPLGFFKSTSQNPNGEWTAVEQDKYYCGVGTGNVFGRELVENHMHFCLLAGIKLSGINAEVAPGQWEFQVGPCIGIEAGDHLWMARYILVKLSERYNLQIDFEPKPLKGNWNGSGCHTNYSTKQMREGEGQKTGLSFIENAIEKLSKKHMEHMELYGANNNERMTGEHETASFDVFSDGIANRGASIRRGNQTVRDQKGYFEDRRPSSNCDPYLVTAKIFKTTQLDD